MPAPVGCTDSLRMRFAQRHERQAFAGLVFVAITDNPAGWLAAVEMRAVFGVKWLCHCNVLPTLVLWWAAGELTKRHWRPVVLISALLQNPFDKQLGYVGLQLLEIARQPGVLLVQ